jgi:pimeloyl-ACP methyl ester carboxylesterase
MTSVGYRTADVDGFKVFYREAGQANAPKLLLLHGFPTAGHMFRDVIPLLANRFHIVAPDLPGFGQSDMPPREKFSYTFDNIAGVIERFTEVIGFDRFAVYVFDYGAPTGFRLAVRQQSRSSSPVEFTSQRPAYDSSGSAANHTGSRMRPIVLENRGPSATPELRAFNPFRPLAPSGP